MSEDESSQKEEARGAAGWAAPPYGEATLAHYCHRPLAYIVIPENLSKGASEIDTAASTGRKTPREKSSLAGRNLPGEIPSRRGDIVTIVIIIALGIIITIIIISTFISTITTPSRCKSWVESCQILRGNFSDVNYSCS
jgi:hypothetical protein